MEINFKHMYDDVIKVLHSITFIDVLLLCSIQDLRGARVRTMIEYLKIN